MSRSTNESKKINDARGPMIVMSTSGMCTAGRIKHHLKRNITQPQNTILFVSVAIAPPAFGAMVGLTSWPSAFAVAARSAR